MLDNSIYFIAFITLFSLLGTFLWFLWRPSDTKRKYFICGCIVISTVLILLFILFVVLNTNSVKV